MTTIIAAVRRRLRGGGDAGLSLVELIVTMMVTGILLAIVGSMFINVALVTSNSNAASQRSSIAGNVVNELAKVIRTASNNAVVGFDDPDPAIVSATATSLTVYSYVDTSPTAPAPSKVTFRVDASGNVFEDRIAGTASGSYWVFTGATTTRSLGGPIISTTLFTYIDTSGQVVVIPATGLTLTQRNTISSIKLSVTVPNSTTTKPATSDAAGNDPITILNTVGMPNLLLTGTDN